MPRKANHFHCLCFNAISLLPLTFKSLQVLSLYLFHFPTLNVSPVYIHFPEGRAGEVNLHRYKLFIRFFSDVHGSAHRKYIPIYIQQDATLHSLFISGNRSTCFWFYFHPSSGAHTTVSTASGICHTVGATCR